MARLDEYGEPRITAQDWAVINARANAVIRHQNRHVMAFSLRLTRDLSPYQTGRYFGVTTDRAKRMVFVGYWLLLNNATVQERFPQLALHAKIVTKWSVKRRKEKS